MTVPAGVTRAETRLRLVDATEADAEMVFRWRNQPDIVAMGLSGREVERDEHEAWFARLLGDPERLLFIAYLDGTPAGQIRFEPAHREGSWDVSVYLLEASRGRGLGPALIDAGCTEAFRRLPTAERIVATIVPSNRRSVGAFQRAGFEPVGEGDVDQDITLALERPPRIPHNRTTVAAEDIEAVSRTVRSGHWAGGPAVRRLEAALAERAGVRHAVCVASGSAALRLSLSALGAGDGTIVAVPAYSCVALPNACLARGARPVPVDVADGRWTIDPTAVGALASPAQLVVAVHTFGLPAAVEELRRSGTKVVEDCAHAFGLGGDGRPLGARGDVAILSFYATKLIAGGEGGAVVTDDDGIAEHVRAWRDYDDRPPHADRDNYKMNDLEAALALSQLSRLDELIRRRASHAARYGDLLADPAAELGNFVVPVSDQPRLWYRYAVDVQGRAAEVVAALASYGIDAALPVTDWRGPKRLGGGVADDAYRSLVSLPLYPTLEPDEIVRVVRAFLSVVSDD